MPQLFDDELNQAMQQLFDETIEVIQLAKVSPDLDDLAATFAVALLKLGLATGFVEQKNPGFARDVEEISASASLRRCRKNNSKRSIKNINIIWRERRKACRPAPSAQQHFASIFRKAFVCLFSDRAML